MTRVILRADTGVDLYAVFSENVDAVLFVGDREAVGKWLADEADRPAERSPVVTEGRLARADAHGTSSLIPLGSGGGFLYGWEDPDIRIMEGPGGRGYLPRGALLAYCGYVATGDEDRAAACVVPDEDED